ncbi:TPA: fimbrial protein [Serratia marcescens]|nr:fimbrial protein [Serratia marcescens]
MIRHLTMVLLCGGMVFSSAWADKKADMTFRGTLIAPPACTIDDDNQVDVNFGDRVGINKVDGVNYRQELNYQIHCENSSSGTWAMKLSLLGSPAGFDSNALVTNKDDLGIRIYQNDKPFTPGSELAINLTSPPRLEAVPVKRGGSTLTEGVFEAWATLRADYR